MSDFSAVSPRWQTDVCNRVINDKKGVSIHSVGYRAGDTVSHLAILYVKFTVSLHTLLQETTTGGSTTDFVKDRSCMLALFGRAMRRRCTVHCMCKGSGRACATGTLYGGKHVRALFVMRLGVEEVANGKCGNSESELRSCMLFVARCVLLPLKYLSTLALAPLRRGAGVESSKSKFGAGLGLGDSSRAHRCGK